MMPVLKLPSWSECISNLDIQNWGPGGSIGLDVQGVPRFWIMRRIYTKTQNFHAFEQDKSKAGHD